MATPSIWIIGDVQGCCGSLDALLAHPSISEEPDAKFWFAGDLVNRGPQSLQTLRRIMSLDDRSTSVLGNHDLHLLAMAAGVKKPSKNDSLLDVLTAPDAGDLINWLRHRPLAHYEHDHLMVHAGVLPKWDVKKTLSLAHEVEQVLRSKNWQKVFLKMYGDEPVFWKEGHAGSKRLRIIINTLTRLRMCTPKGHMALNIKSSPESHRGTLVPWFDLPNRATSDVTIVFGHWSTLGLKVEPHIICLDTGCVWGGHLTAMRLQDRALVQIPCHQSIDPF
jgi:bis(5'-nucleosyl)-tetraphosphatase (symmetrical)